MISEVASTVRVMRSHPVQYDAILQPRSNNVKAEEMGLLQKYQYHLRNESPSSGWHSILCTGLHSLDFSRRYSTLGLSSPISAEAGHSHRLAVKMGIKSKRQFANKNRMGIRSKSILEDFGQNTSERASTKTLKGTEVA